jgi:basic amino acid/polyamine antiporter, APA family
LDGPATAEGLRRRLGVTTATSLIVASMIGTGIFSTTGLMLARVGSAWLVLLCWLLGGLVALAGALSYAELATMMPQAGGEYIYLRKCYGPLAGFLSGWTSFLVGFSAPIAASAVACAKYFSAGGWLPGTPLAQDLMAVGIVLSFTALHVGSVRMGAYVQNALTAIKLLLLGGLVLAGFSTGRGSWKFLHSSSGFWASPRWGQMGISLLWVTFAYSGWNASSYIAGEVERPARTLPRSLLIGTVTVTAVYLLINLFFFYAAPPATLTGVIAVGETAAEHLFGAATASWLSVIMGLALLSSLSAYVITGPRIYYAMARDALFFRFAARVHPRFETPAVAIAAQGLCAILMILFGTFEQLLTYIGFALGIFSWMAVAGVLLLRRREPALERPYRLGCYPFVPIFYIAAMGGILIVAFVNRPGPSLAAVLTVAAGILAYWLYIRPSLSREST